MRYIAVTMKLDMDQILLRKVQLALLDILKDIDKVCKKYDIPYWLEAGTLLGSVRHKGFIPWDDDIDIAMKRNDYNRFIDIAQKEFGDEYFVQNWHTDLNYGLTFTKVIKNYTIYSQYSNREVGARQGFFVDVFPFDVFPNSKIQRIIQKSQIWPVRGMIAYKCGYDMTIGRSKKNLILSYPIKKLASLFSREKMIKFYETKIQKFNHFETGMIFSCNGSPYGRYVILEEWLGSLTPRQFEDGIFPCPDNVHEQLKMAYGDYMKLPPEEKRQLGHRIIEVCFDTRKEDEVK